MPLSVSETRLLEQEYSNLSNFLTDKEVFLAQKTSIIEFCREENIALYNITALKWTDAQQRLKKLVDLFAHPKQKLEVSEVLRWKEEFSTLIKLSDEETINLHHHAYKSVGDEYLKTKKVSPNTLLTMQDMTDLFTTKDSENLAVFTPVSLTEMSSDQKENLNDFLTLADNKDIFLPLNHEGHWFYLLRQNGSWSAQDSQPIVNNQSSPRQVSIVEKSRELLQSLNIKTELKFASSGKQLNNYDCGTQVINAYRNKVDASYIGQSHQDTIIELLENQLPPLLSKKKDNVEKKANTMESDQSIDKSLSKKALKVIEATASTQVCEKKTKLYKKNLKELVAAVSEKGLFTNINNKIATNAIDKAQASDNETDADFAERLQEAEFRKVGLDFSK